MTPEELRQRFEDEKNINFRCRYTGRIIPEYMLFLESLICNPWTKVEDELPIIHEYVIVPRGCGYFDGIGWYSAFTGRPIQWTVDKWMKIPE